MDQPNTEKRFSFEFKVLGLLFLILAIVAVTGILAYQRLNHIVDTISYESRPDAPLIIVKDILNDLSDAENSVKSYSLTKDDNYLALFYEKARQTDEKLDELQQLAGGDEQTMPLIDSLENMVEQKYNLLNELLTSQDKYRGRAALDKVLKTMEMQEKVDTLVRDTTLMVQQNPVIDSVESGKKERKKKEGFFARLFGSKKNKDTDTMAVAGVPQQVVVISDTAKEKEALKDISEEVKAIRKQEKLLEQKMKSRDLELIRQDKLIMDQIRSLVNYMEGMQMNTIAQKTEMTEKLAAETKFLIAAFCVSATILLLFAAIVIVNYVRNNNKYRQALRSAKQEAEDLAKAKERFLANMSHEIRTPMNAISGFTEQLLSSSLDRPQRENLDIIRKSVDYLLHIINDVLDYSKLQAGKLKLEMKGFRPAGVLKDSFALLESLAKNKNISLTYFLDEDIPEILLGDPVRVQQIILNLAGNAIKFTSKGKVTIKMFRQNLLENGLILKIEVADTGIGMDKPDLEKIFGEFEQVESSSRAIPGGTGLGLAITKKLTELMKGTIEVFSRRGKGTTISVSIPFDSGSENDLPREQLVETEAGDLKGLNILLADDEEFNRKLLRSILEKHQIKYKEAENGHEVLALVLKQDFDVILLDVRMPEMNGIEAAREIRKIKPGIPLIALTAAVSDEDRQLYRDAGMAAFLPKPFAEAELLKVISSVLEKNKNKDEKEIAGLDEKKENIKNVLIEKDEQPLDIAALWKLSNGDESFFREMLEKYIISAQQGIAAMKLALGKEDWQQISEQAHKLSPPSKYVGADKLFRMLKKAEKDFRKSKPAGDSQKELKAIEKEVRNVIKQIRAILKKKNISKGLS